MNATTRQSLLLVSLLTPQVALAAAGAVGVVPIEGPPIDNGAMSSDEAPLSTDARRKLAAARLMARQRLEDHRLERQEQTARFGVPVSDRAYAAGIASIGRVKVLTDEEYLRTYGLYSECSGPQNAACTYVAKLRQLVVLTETYLKISAVEAATQADLAAVLAHEASHVMLAYAGMPLSKQEQYLREVWTNPRVGGVISPPPSGPAKRTGPAKPDPALRPKKPAPARETRPAVRG
jgi:hypothetical protein